MNIVVGSGPAGVFAAAALLDRGEGVTLLDVGRALEPVRSVRVGALSLREPGAWTDDELAFLRPAAPLDPRLPKASYGSTFPYALAELDRWEQHGTRCLHSHARGGLSNVWGAAVLPYRERDLVGWPVSADDLAPHYAAVEARLGIAADDELAADFPLYAPPASPAPLSRQAARIYEHMVAHRAELRGAGVTFGRSRLALHTNPGDPRRCRRSGQCHFGCPYGAIWNASELLDVLCRDARMHYRPGVRVGRVERTGASVRVHGRAVDGGGAVTVTGDRAFLGCGPVGTAQIVAASLGRGALELPLVSQPYFLLPMLMLDGVGGVESEALHTLAQLFVELDDARVSRHRVHLQVYTHNSFIRDRVEAMVGPLGANARRALTARLIAVQGYLHSDEGAPIALRIGGGEADAVSLRASQSGARATIGRAIAALARNTQRLGLVPLAPWMRIGLPGEGNHVGATFPMRRAPGVLETDRRGALPGLPGVYMIDASVLPTLPAPTLTLTVMANAHRIASEVADTPCAAR